MSFTLVGQHNWIESKTNTEAACSAPWFASGQDPLLRIIPHVSPLIICYLFNAGHQTEALNATKGSHIKNRILT